VKADLSASVRAERARQGGRDAIVAKINAGFRPRRPSPRPACRCRAAARHRRAPDRHRAPNQPVPPPLAMMFSLPGQGADPRRAERPGLVRRHLEHDGAGQCRKAPELVQATRTQFQRFLSEEYARSSRARAEAGLKVKRNEEAIAQAEAAAARGRNGRNNAPRACMILVVDNYDSFTWNLVHYLRELGAEVRVVRNDEIGVAEALASGAEAFLISPGPGTPDEAGISSSWSPPARRRGGRCSACASAIRRSASISAAVVRAPQPMHGKTCAGGA
jgi:hypothetical protein